MTSLALPVDLWMYIMSFLDTSHCKTLAIAVGRTALGDHAFDQRRLTPLLVNGLRECPSKWCEEAFHFCMQWQSKTLAHALMLPAVINVSDIYYMKDIVQILPHDEQQQCFERTIGHVDFVGLKNWTIAYFRFIGTHNFEYTDAQVDELWNFFWLFVNMNCHVMAMMRELRFFVHDCTPSMLSKMALAARRYAQLEPSVSANVRVCFSLCLPTLVRRYICENLSVRELADFCACFHVDWFSEQIQILIWSALFFASNDIGFIRDKITYLFKERLFLSAGTSAMYIYQNEYRFNNMQCMVGTLPETRLGTSGLILRQPQAMRKMTHSDFVSFTLHFLCECPYCVTFTFF